MTSASTKDETKRPANCRRVVVLGASQNPERYAHKALLMLRQAGYQVVPVHPVLQEIDGLPVVKRLADVGGEVDTLTIYIAAKNLPALINDIRGLHPRRVIFNPGTENVETMEALSHVGIECVEGCTLVMLATGQF